MGANITKWNASKRDPPKYHMVLRTGPPILQYSNTDMYQWFETNTHTFRLKTPTMTTRKLTNIHFWRPLEPGPVNIELWIHFNIASSQIDGSKGLLGIVSTTDSRNMHGPKSGLYNHSMMIGDSSQHIASMQKWQWHGWIKTHIIDANNSRDVRKRSEDFIRGHRHK
jgi:hypothetical protein